MTHLHLHSKYSLRDSIIKTEDLIPRLHEIGHAAVAITDHGASLGGVSIYKELKKAGIKYIHGCEMYTCDDTSIKDKNSKYHHLIVLCKNDVGRVNLNRLITLSNHPDNKYVKPRIDFAKLCAHKDGLIVASACLAGEIPRLIMAGEHEQAALVATKYRDAFGEDYYLEIQSRMDEEQIAVNKRLVEIAQKLDIRIIVTCDAHYVNLSDKKYQNNYAFNGSYKEDGESYLDNYVQSDDEVRARLPYLPPDVVEAAMRETDAVAAKCNVEMPLSAPIMPKMDTPPEFKNNGEWLRSICVSGFRDKLNIDMERAALADPNRYFERPVYDDAGKLVRVDQFQPSQEVIDAYLRRFEYEYTSLQRMGFIDYILLVYTYANIAKRRGIARGSGGGSLVCYTANITNIDPLEHRLYFERFIDVGALPLLESGAITPKELKIPDIDLDFSGESCEEVLRYLYDEYGECRVASIGKFSNNFTRGATRDMCKVLGYSLDEEDRIAKSFGEYELSEIDAMIDGIVPVVESAKEAIRNVKANPELFDYVRKLMGLPKAFGLHACGKIISVGDLDDYLPSSYDKDGIRYLQGDMHDVEDVGLVKIDVLGLRTIDHEYDALEMSGEPESFIDPKQSYGDPKVLDIFKRGDTIGIFQFSSPGMRDTLKKMDVRGIDDLAVANALFRPGAMAYIDSFCARRHGKEITTFLHPDLEPILKETYGIIVFQEQLIEIGRLAGIHNPDLLRKATGKKDPKLLAQVKPELGEKLLIRGWTQTQFDTLWADMLEFAKYSFNKSHAAAYGIIAYMTAKLKAYYPAEFFAGLFNSYIGKSFPEEDAIEISTDMFAHKIKLAQFNYRKDHRKCSVEDGAVRYGIPLIKDMNVKAAEALYLISGIGFDRFWQITKGLLDQGVDRAQMKTLIRLGFFDSIGKPEQLVRIFSLYDKFYTRKKLNASELDDSPISSIVKKHSTNIGKKGNELKSYTILDHEAIMNEVEAECLSVPMPELPYTEIVRFHQEKVGFVSLVTNKTEDRPKLFVKAVYPVKRKRDGKQFGYSIITQSLGSGITARFTVFNRVYDREPISKGDVIKCLHYERDGQYFTMDKYEVMI